MNKHIRALRNVGLLILAFFYIGGVPSLIVHLGIENNWRGFNKGAPMHEMWEVTLLAWFFGNCLFFTVSYGLYFLCYGMYREGEK